MSHCSFTSKYLNLDPCHSSKWMQSLIPAQVESRTPRSQKILKNSASNGWFPCSCHPKWCILVFVPCIYTYNILKPSFQTSHKDVWHCPLVLLTVLCTNYFASWMIVQFDVRNRTDVVCQVGPPPSRWDGSGERIVVKSMAAGMDETAELCLSILCHEDLYQRIFSKRSLV